MVREMIRAALAAALLAQASIPAGAQASRTGLEATQRPSVSIPAEAQPSQAELEAALLTLNVRIAAHPEACRKGVGCIKAPKAIKVRNYDCQARGKDSKGGDILYCRTTYVYKGGSFDTVKSPDECIPLRATERAAVDGRETMLAWEVAMVDHKGKCPGARE